MNAHVLPAQGQYELRLDDGTVIGRFDAPGAEGYIIGRSDEKSHYVPDIDLAIFGALDRGVSRRHIALVSYRHSMHLIDLASINGTFINGERVKADEPYPLREGDIVRLGTINLSLIKVT
jgi:pSer/pThr/pTyr-binding forkhead associated (FHA) protein